MNDVLSAILSLDIEGIPDKKDIEISLDETVGEFRKDLLELLIYAFPNRFHSGTTVDIALNDAPLSHSSDSKTFRELSAWDGSRLAVSCKSSHISSETANKHKNKPSSSGFYKPKL